MVSDWINHVKSVLLKYSNGETVIAPENLKELDPNEVLFVYGNDTKEYQKQKWRDLLKRCVMKTVSGVILVILGIENQSEVHYAMPVRAMVYDALNYGEQADAVARKHRKSEKSGEKVYNNAAEFLSGLKKGDYLIPMITLTLYWGADAWDGPLKLSDLFDSDALWLKEYVNDYKLHLVAPEGIEDFSKFQTELGAVLSFIRASKSEEEMGKVVQENEMFRNLGRESVSTINVFTGAQIPIEEEEEKVDMCKAWEDHRKSGVEEGKQELIKSLIMKNRITREDAAEELGVTIEELNLLFAEEKNERKED